MLRLICLLVLVSPCIGAVAQEVELPNVNSALSWQPMQNGLFNLHAEPALKPMRLNKMHYWTLRLVDDEQRAVEGAKIDVDGGMPDHGHGLSTVPRVTPGDEPGQYLLKGMRFNMSGVWQLKFTVHHKSRSDRLQLGFVVEDSTGR